MVINTYFNYCSQFQCIPQVGSFKSIETLLNYFEESVLIDEELLGFSSELMLNSCDEKKAMTTHWRRIEKVWDSCLNFRDFSRFKVSFYLNNNRNET